MSSDLTDVVSIRGLAGVRPGQPFVALGIICHLGGDDSGAHAAQTFVWTPEQAEEIAARLIAAAAEARTRETAARQPTNLAPTQENT